MYSTRKIKAVYFSGAAMKKEDPYYTSVRIEEASALVDADIRRQVVADNPRIGGSGFLSLFVDNDRKIAALLNQVKEEMKRSSSDQDGVNAYEAAVQQKLNSGRVFQADIIKNRNEESYSQSRFWQQICSERGLDRAQTRIGQEEPDILNRFERIDNAKMGQEIAAMHGSELKTLVSRFQSFEEGVHEPRLPRTASDLKTLVERKSGVSLPSLG